MMKSCYLQLERLYREVKYLDPNSISPNDLILFDDRYQNIIESSENHNEFDYYFTIWKLQSSGAVIDKEIKGTTKVKTLGEWIGRKIVWLLAALFPLVLFSWFLNLL